MPDEIKFVIDADNLADTELARLIAQIGLLTQEVKQFSNVGDENLARTAKTVKTFLLQMSRSAEFSAEQFDLLRKTISKLSKGLDDSGDDADAFVGALSSANSIIKQFNKGYKSLGETQEREANQGMKVNEYLKQGITFRKSMVRYNSKLEESQDSLTREVSQYISALERVQKLRPGYGMQGGLASASSIGGVSAIRVPQAEDAIKSKNLSQIIGLTKQLKKETKSLSDIEKQQQSQNNILKKQQESQRKEEIRAFESTVGFKKKMIAYNNKLFDTYKLINKEVDEYARDVERLSKRSAITKNKDFLGHPGMADSVQRRRESVAPTKNLTEYKKLLDDVRDSRKHLSKVEKQASKDERMASEINRDSIKQTKKSYDRLLEVVKRYVSIRERSGKVASERNYAKVLKLVADRARATGASLKEVERAKNLIIKANNRESDSIGRLTNKLSIVNVQYFTMTNILNDLESGFERAFQYATRWMKTLIEAGGEMEKLGRTVSATEGSLAGGQQRLNTLISTSIDLIGVSLQSIIKYNSQLRAAGLTVKQVDTVISAVGKSIAELGKSTYESERVLLQLSQGIAGNKIVLQDLRPILEEIPQFWNAASITFQTAVRDVDALRDAVDAAGIERGAGLIKTMETLNKYAVGADMTTYAAQVEVLQEKFFLLQSGIGRNLLPIINKLVAALNEMLEWFNKLNEGVKRWVSEGLLLATVAIIGLTAVTKSLVAVLTAFYTLKGAGVVIEHMTGQSILLTRVFSKLAAAGSKLGKVFAGLFTPGGLIAVGAVAFLSALFYLIHRLNEPVKELERSYDKLGSTISEINRNIFNNSAIRQMADDMAEQIKELDKSGGRFEKANSRLIHGYVKQIKFIETILGKDKGATKNILAERINETRAALRELNRQFKLINTIQETGKDRVKRFYALSLEISNAEKNLDALMAKLNSLDKEAKKSKYEDDIVYMEWAIRRAEDIFSNVKALKEIEAAAEHLTGVLSKQLDLRLDNEKLTSSDILDLKQEFAYASVKIELDRDKKFKEIMKDLSSAWSKHYSDIDKENKDVYKRMTDRIKKTSKDWSKAVNTSVKSQIEDMKKLGKQVKEAQEKYPQDTFIENLFKPEVKASSSGSIRRFGYYQEMMQALDTKDIDKRAARAREIFERYRSMLTNSTDKNQKEIKEIMEKWNNEIMDLRVDLWKNYQEYLEKIDEHTKRKSENFMKTMKGVMNQTKGFGIFYAATLKSAFHFPELGRFFKNIEEPMKDHLKNSEKMNADYAKKMERLYERLSKKLADTLIDFIFDRDKSFQDIALQFIKSSLRIIAQHYIETEIRISNERRVQAEVAKTQALQSGGGLINTLISAIKNPKSLLGGVGGAGVALGGASLLAPKEVGNAGSGVLGILTKLGKGLESIPDKAFGVFDNPKNDRFAGASGKGVARDIAYNQISKAASRSAHDQMDFFNANFKDEFGKLLSSIPNQSGGERPVIQVHVHTKIGKREIEQIFNEADAAIEEGRMTTRFARK